MSSTRIVVVIALVFASSLSAHAQDAGRFQAGVQFVTASIGELDSTDMGVSGRISWLPLPMIGLEGELGIFPSDLPEDTAVTASRFEGLFGVTAGPQVGPIRIFGRARPGFVRFSEAPAPIACITIFPPTLRCTLAEGHTGFAFDLGGGIEVQVARHLSLRVDLGDRMVRYPGSTIDIDGEVHDEDFYEHEFRFAIGAGWTF